MSRREVYMLRFADKTAASSDNKSYLEAVDEAMVTVGAAIYAVNINKTKTKVLVNTAHKHIAC